MQIKWAPFWMAMGNWSLGGRFVVEVNGGTRHELVRAFEGIGDSREVPITVLESTFVYVWEHL